PPASASCGDWTCSTRASTPAALSLSAVRCAVAWLESADVGASGSGESEGIATSAVQKSEESAPPLLILVSVTPGARVVTVRFSGRSAAPRLRWEAWSVLLLFERTSSALVGPTGV